MVRPAHHKLDSRMLLQYLTQIHKNDRHEYNIASIVYKQQIWFDMSSRQSHEVRCFNPTVTVPTQWELFTWTATLRGSFTSLTAVKLTRSFYWFVSLKVIRHGRDLQLHNDKKKNSQCFVPMRVETYSNWWKWSEFIKSRSSSHSVLQF